MARNGRDLFERSTFNRTPTADEILSGRAVWNEGTQSWDFKGKKAATPVRAPKPKAEKPKGEPQAIAGGMSRAEAKEAANKWVDKMLQDPKNPMEAEARERLVAILTRDFGSNPDKWDNGLREMNKMEMSKSHTQILAYLHARDSGLLKGGETDVLKQVEQFRQMIGSERVNGVREYGVSIDKDGNIIHAVKGGSGSVGVGVPRDARGYPPESMQVKGSFGTTRAADQRVIYAGSTFHHNHPRDNDPTRLGMSFSSGDLYCFVAEARGAMTALANEGTYVIRNPNWRETASRSYSENTSVSHRVSAMRTSAERLIRNAQRTEYALRKGNWSADEQRKWFAVRLHAANLSIARANGFEIDFIPNKGYESLKAEYDTAASLVNK